MKIKYIFFDFDGVLAESVDVKTEAFRQMYLKHGDSFAQRVVDHHKNNGGVSRFEKFKIYNGQWLNELVDEKRIESLAENFSNLVVEGVVNADEVPGAKEFLESSNEITKFIITGTPTTEITPILKKRGMFDFFKGVYGSPEKKDFWVIKILTDLKINQDECVFIGDALTDYNAALNNDITFILRETNDAKELFKDFKGYRIKDITELSQVLNQI